MRVLCIENSICTHDSKAICVFKDSIYNVTKEVKLKQICRGSDIWYELLETGIYLHSSTIFVEIDDLVEEIEEVEILQETL